jgi:hypothetical protein
MMTFIWVFSLSWMNHLYMPRATSPARYRVKFRTYRPRIHKPSMFGYAASWNTKSSVVNAFKES